MEENRQGAAGLRSIGYRLADLRRQDCNRLLANILNCSPGGTHRVCPVVALLSAMTSKAVVIEDFIFVNAEEIKVSVPSAADSLLLIVLRQAMRDFGCSLLRISSHLRQGMEEVVRTPERQLFWGQMAGRYDKRTLK